MPTETNIEQLVINKLTQAKYDELDAAGQVLLDQLYLITDGETNAINVIYNNQKTKLKATNVQDAIDEINAKIGSGSQTAVLYTEQTLEESQKEQARKNIDTVASVDMMEKLDKDVGKNIFNRKSPNIIFGKSLRSDGSEFDAKDRAISDYMKVKPNTEYTLNQFGIGGSSLCFYDKNLNFVSSISGNAGLAPKNGTFVVPSNAEYIRTPLFVEYYAKCQIEQGTKTTEYEEYTPYKAVPELQEKIEQQIESLFPIAPEDTDFFKLDNLADPNLFVRNAFISQYGDIKQSASYFYTGYIGVVPNQTITIGENARFIAAYDANKNVLNKLGSGSAVSKYVVPEGVYYIIVSGWMTSIDKFVVNVGDDVLTYVPYGYKVKDDSIGLLPVQTVAGSDAAFTDKISLAPGEKLEINNFPTALKKGLELSGEMKFSSFAPVRFGIGKGVRNGHWVEVTSANIVLHKYTTEDVTVESKPHGLNVANYLKFAINVDNKSICTVAINTISGTYQATFDLLFDAAGVPFIDGDEELQNVKIKATSKEFRHNLWMFGDSYFGVNSQRVIGQLRELGYIDNLLISGKSGDPSPVAFQDLYNALLYGTPKFLVWALGMNDNAENYKVWYSRVKAICKAKGITLIAEKIPTVPGQDKAEINAFIEAEKIRYIDGYGAVGATPDGTWYPGYLSSDKVHPTELGAKALAMQFLVDVPEIMEYL